MWNKQKYCGQLQNHVWIANFTGGSEKLPSPQNLRISSWSYDMEGHAKKCVERYCELADSLLNSSTKYLHHACIDDHHFKEEEMKSVGEFSQVCSQIVLKCLYLARIGRPDILRSVNKLARSITKWTKDCDKRLNRLISHVHHTCEYKQYCHVGNTAKQCRLGLFQDSDFRGRSWRFKIHFWRNTVHFRKSYVCSNKLDVQETNCCFAQLNRIWIYLFGHWTESGWFDCSGTVGSNCFCLWKRLSCFRSIRATWLWC